MTSKPTPEMCHLSQPTGREPSLPWSQTQGPAQCTLLWEVPPPPFSLRSYSRAAWKVPQWDVTHQAVDGRDERRYRNTPRGSGPHWELKGGHICNWEVLKEAKLCPGKRHMLSGATWTAAFSFGLDKQLAWLVLPCVPGGGSAGRNRWALSIAQDGAPRVHCSTGLCPLLKDDSATSRNINFFPLGWEWGGSGGSSNYFLQLRSPPEEAFWTL